MQQSDDILLQQAASAVCSQLDPQLPSEKRAELSNFLAEFKRLDRVTSLALNLMRPVWDHRVRHFGMSILVEQVDCRWRSDGLSLLQTLPFSQAQRAQLASTLLAMLQSYDATSLASEPAYIKEKMATLIASVVIRQWPAPDQSYLNKILELADLSLEHFDLICGVLRAVAEELTREYPTDSLSSPHRSNVGSAISKFAAESNCFYLLYSQLERSYAIWQQRATEGCGPAELFGYSLRLRSILAMLQSWADLVPLALFFRTQSQQHSFARVAVLLFGHPDLTVQQAAADLLVVIYSRCISSSLDKPSALLLFDHVVDLRSFAGQLVAAVEASRIEGNGQLWHARYNLLRRIVQIHVLLGLIHLDLLNIKQLPDSYQAFISLMLDLTCFGSLQLAELLMPFWKRWTSIDVIQRETMLFASVCSQLVRNSRLIFLHWPYLHWPSSMLSISDMQLIQLRAYQELDFEDKLDWQRAFGTLRSDISTLYRVICQHSPDSMLQCTLELAQLMSTMDPAVNAVILDGLSRIFKAFHNALPERLFSHPTLELIAGCVFDVAAASAHVLENQLLCVKGLTRFYAVNPAWMERALVKCLTSIQCKFTAGQIDSRRQACIAFAHLASELSRVLLPHLSFIVDLVRPLMSDVELLAQDRMMLLEGLAAIASVASPDVAASLLSELLADPLQQYQSTSLLGICSSLAVFAEFCGVSAVATGDQPGLLRGHHNRRQLQIIVQTLMVIWKKTSAVADLGNHPLSQHDPNLLYSTCQLIRTFQSLWLPNVKQELVSVYQAGFLLEPDEAVVQAWLRREADETKPHTTEGEIRNWLSSVRDGCYMLSSSIAAHIHPFFTSPHLVAQFVEALCYADDSQPPINMISILSKAAIPILRRAFDAARLGALPNDSVVHMSHLASKLIQSYLVTLDRLWNSHRSQGQFAFEKSTGLDLVESDVIAERALRTASIEFVKFIDSVIFAAPELRRDDASHSVRHVNPVFSSLMASQKSGFIAEAFSTILSWPDTAALSATCSTLSNFVALLSHIGSTRQSAQKVRDVRLDKNFLDILSRKIFAALVQLLPRVCAAHLPIANSVLNLIRDVWCIGSDIPAKVLASFSHSSESAVQSLRSQVTAARSQSAARNIFKLFFKSVFKIDVDSAVAGKTALDVKQFSKVIDSKPVEDGTQDSQDLELLDVYRLFD